MNDVRMLTEDEVVLAKGGTNPGGPGSGGGQGTGGHTGKGDGLGWLRRILEALF